MQTITATVKIMSGKHFHKGLREAKRSRGRFDPATKTWTVTLVGADANMLNAPAAYGWTLISRSDVPQTSHHGRCPHYTADQGCPLHGETCR